MNRLHQSEYYIETYLKREVEALGGEVRKVRWVGRNNAPDRFVLLPTKNSIWVELKATGKKPTKAQLREHERMQRFGEKVLVIDSVNAVEDFLLMYG